MALVCQRLRGLKMICPAAPVIGWGVGSKMSLLRGCVNIPGIAGQIFPNLGWKASGMQRKVVKSFGIRVGGGIHLPPFLAYYNSGGEKQRGSGICQILWQLFPSFARIQGQTLISPFLLNFTPFSIRQALALFGNFGLVESSLILFIYAVSCAYSFFPFLLGVYLRYFFAF